MKKILIVEDKADLLEILGELAEPYFEVSTAKDISAAVRILRTQKFEVMLTDLRLPGGCGLELLESASVAVRALITEANVAKFPKADRDRIAQVELIPKPWINELDTFLEKYA